MSIVIYRGPYSRVLHSLAINGKNKKQIKKKMGVGFDLFESQLVQYLLASRLESQGKPLELPAGC